MNMEKKMRIQLGSKILFQPDKTIKIQINFQNLKLVKTVLQENVPQRKRSLGRELDRNYAEKIGSKSQIGHRESETRDGLEGVSIEQGNLEANLLNI